MDRKAAIAYANAFWDRPCQDGTFWNTKREIIVSHERARLKASAADGWEARFVPDGAGAEEAAFIQRDPDGISIASLPGKWNKITIWPWAGLADCAHFLSECLKAGKVQNAYSVSVPRLVKLLAAFRPSVMKTLAEKRSKDACQRVIDTGLFQPGDFIGYFNTDPQGDYGEIDYTHSAMYVGGKFITCHTYCRYEDRGNFAVTWDIKHGFNYTLLHFTDGDPQPSQATLDLLLGWWEVTALGKTLYYFFQRDGSVISSSKKPSSKTTAASGQHGYWYEKDLEVIIFWNQRDDSNVERIELTGIYPAFNFDKTAASRSLSMAGGGTATRLF